MAGYVRSARCEDDLHRFRELRSLTPGSAEHTKLRAELINAHLPLVYRIARGFDRRGVSLEELVQVGSEALVRAVDHFDPDRGNGFMVYAHPSISGSMKRYFRDFAWSIRPSRRTQELWVAIKRVRPALTQRLGRPPSNQELAAELHAAVPEVEQALEVNDDCTALSLDVHGQGEDGGEMTLYEQLGEADPGIALVEDRVSLWPALNALPERDRMILLMRFYGNQSQREISAALGLSQMHVSRLLRGACAKLREALLSEMNGRRPGGRDGERGSPRPVAGAGTAAASPAGAAAARGRRRGP